MDNITRLFIATTEAFEQVDYAFAIGGDSPIGSDLLMARKYIKSALDKITEAKNKKAKRTAAPAPDLTGGAGSV